MIFLLSFLNLFKQGLVLDYDRLRVTVIVLQLLISTIKLESTASFPEGSRDKRTTRHRSENAFHDVPSRALSATLKGIFLH